MSRTGSEILFYSRPRPGACEEEWYEHADESHFWFSWRLRACVGMLRDLGIPMDASWEVLDIGSGPCLLQAQIESASAWRVHCADVNPSALERGRPARGTRMCYDIREEKPELLGAFDAVLLFDVLEHLESTRPFLVSLIRHVRPGGVILVNVPALQGMYSAYDRAVGHVRRYDVGTLAAEFDGLEAEILAQRYWGAALLPVLALRRVLLRDGPERPAIVRRGFRRPRPLVNAVLRSLARLECAMWRRPPLGTSLLLAARRRS